MTGKVYEGERVGKRVRERAISWSEKCIKNMTEDIRQEQ